MAITRANVEQLLVYRNGPIMTKAGMDGTTVNGTNVDLADPIGWGLRQSGYSVTDITSPSNTDLASVPAADYDQVVDLSEQRQLSNILGNLDDVDITLGPRSEYLNQLSQQVENKLDRIQKRNEKAYGVGAAALDTMVITDSFAEHYTGLSTD